MMFEFDEGGGDSKGPYISWHVKAREDGTAKAKSFSMKDGDERIDITDEFKKGVVFDIDNMKTGWSLFGQNGSDWRWNQTMARFDPKPDEGDDWKRGVSIPIALSEKETALWQQAGAGTWIAITRLSKLLQDREGDKLPEVKMIGTEPEKFNGGGSTVCAQFEVAKWVDRPDCLNGSDESMADLADDGDDDDEF